MKKSSFIYSAALLLLISGCSSTKFNDYWQNEYTTETKQPYTIESKVQQTETQEQSLQENTVITQKVHLND